jgi:hypothetical protein
VMRFPCRRSPRIVITLICACSLVGLFLFQANLWHDWARESPSIEERYVARYEPLRGLMPSDEVSQFLVDEAHADLALLHRDARLYLAQYAVSPKRLGRDLRSRWIVVDSDRGDVPPGIATSAHWSLVADLGNGVRLYRNDLGE